MFSRSSSATETVAWSPDPSDGRAAAISVLPGVPLPPGLVTFTPDALAAAVDAAFPDSDPAPAAERSADELVSVGAPTAIVDATHVVAPAPRAGSRRTSFSGLLRRGKTSDVPDDDFAPVPVDPGWQALAPDPVVAPAPPAPTEPAALAAPVVVAPVLPRPEPLAPSAFAPPAAPAPVSDEDPLLGDIPLAAVVVAEPVAAAPPAPPVVAVLAPPVGLPVPLPPPADYVPPVAVTPPPPYVPEPFAPAPVASFAHLVPTQQLTFPASMEAAAAKVAAQIAAEHAAAASGATEAETEADTEPDIETPKQAAPTVGLVFADGSHAEVADGPDSDALQHVAGVLAGDEPAAPIE